MTRSFPSKYLFAPALLFLWSTWESNPPHKSCKDSSPALVHGTPINMSNNRKRLVLETVGFEPTTFRYELKLYQVS